MEKVTGSAKTRHGEAFLFIIIIIIIIGGSKRKQSL